MFSPKPKPPTQQQTQAMKDLDMLGQNLLQQNLPKNLPIKPQDTGYKTYVVCGLNTFFAYCIMASVIKFQ